MPTISKGKSILIPKTAMAIHQVRNLFCRFSSIFFKIFAFTTALSNDSETSRTDKIIMIKTVCSPFMIFQSWPNHKKNHKMIAMIVKIIDHLKNFI